MDVKALKPAELDELTCNILLTGQKNIKLTVDEKMLTRLCVTACEVFNSQEMMIEINGPVNVCGDLHGQFGDLLRLFDKCGFPPESNYLFLGDYVDRGPLSLETISLLFCYKARYPHNMFLLRGNHETRDVNRVYGFYEECQLRYSLDLYRAYSTAFEFMPLTGLIGEKILCMHGGISPSLYHLDQLRDIKRPLEPTTNMTLELDVLWSDPQAGVQGYTPSTRGASYCFGEDALNDKLQKLNLDMVVRAHQVVNDGFEFFANRKLVTVFSAPLYCGQFNNSGAVMQISEDLTCSFTILQAIVDKHQQTNEQTVATICPARERTTPPPLSAASPGIKPAASPGMKASEPSPTSSSVTKSVQGTSPSGNSEREENNSGGLSQGGSMRRKSAAKLGQTGSTRELSTGKSRSLSLNKSPGSAREAAASAREGTSASPPRSKGKQSTVSPVSPSVTSGTSSPAKSPAANNDGFEEVEGAPCKPNKESSNLDDELQKSEHESKKEKDEEK
ncbi:unnamed protein product [Bursaphelenchus okinawaensis]|uniref:Serine/threonine-protein phosphatase n=1 Tax=Bursaphelenchus okinawaensis TaxID=465554 RepID=A0A811KEL2_9BILA|nr:unnamed protein product [Bursaphelenchus okinawaensis]CAG9102255.1 unnamed protein product [Bursaphelenchus okinawaensis]